MKITITHKGSILIEPENNLEVFFINQIDIKNIGIIKETQTLLGFEHSPYIKIKQNKEKNKK